MPRYLLSIFLLLQAFVVFGVEGLFYAGAQNKAMANANINSSNVWANFYNQAGLANAEFPEVGVYSERRFLENVFSQHSLGLVLPANKAAFGISASRFGSNIYSENKLGLALAKKLGNYISAGLQFNYHFNNIKETEPTGNFLIEGGLMSTIDNLKVGIHLFNPTNARIDKNFEERIPVILTAGASYYLEPLTLALALQQEAGQQHSVRTGLNYLVREQISLQLGYASNPNQLAFGIGYAVAVWHFNVSFTNNNPIGLTPQASISYGF
ncbi:MAG: hypothetical protein HC896_13035 [Bacteroidales bacterium]|nr:hypothetical protein [Bacteroidales bacterium]